MADDCMRYVHTLAIVLNCRKNTELYRKIFNEEGLDAVPEYLPEPKEKKVTVRGSDYLVYEPSNIIRNPS